MKKKIVCLGDSITCNWEGVSYPELWQQLIDQYRLPYKIINAGVNGEIAQDGYYRLVSEVIIHKPNIVTIMFGHNEIGRGLPINHYEQYLNLIIQKLKHHLPSVLIWVLSPNKIGLKSQIHKYQPLLKILLTPDNRFTYINIWQEFEGQDLDSIYTDQFNYDGLTGLDWLHPNQKGHQIIANKLFLELSKITR